MDCNSLIGRAESRETGNIYVLHFYVQGCERCSPQRAPLGSDVTGDDGAEQRLQGGVDATTLCHSHMTHTTTITNNRGRGYTGIGGLILVEKGKRHNIREKDRERCREKREKINK